MQNHRFREPGRCAFLAVFLLLLWLAGGCGGGSSAPTGGQVDSALIGRYVSTSQESVASRPAPIFTVLQNGSVKATLLLNGVTYNTVGNATNNQVEFEFKVDSNYYAFGGTFASTNNPVQVKGDYAVQAACTKDNPPCASNALATSWTAQKQ